MSYVLFLYNNNRVYSIVGTPTGKSFQSKDAAKRAASRYRRLHPSVDVEVNEIQAGE